jgi:hypothetical protein
MCRSACSCSSLCTECGTRDAAVVVASERGQRFSSQDLTAMIAGSGSRKMVTAFTAGTGSNIPVRLIC